MPARILVIEDNEANLDLMAYLLRAFGHRVSVARDGHAGLAAVRAERPDLALCDIHLPGIGGIELANRLRSDPTLHRIPLVAVTAFAMASDRETIMAAGFDGCLTKPITPETFVAQVEAFLPAQLRGGFARPEPAPPAPQPPSAQRGRTILAVDDRPENLELAAGILEPSGYRVVTATGMRAALALALESPPDLILSDVVMAQGSGYEFIHAVKADARLRDIPFIFITATMTTPNARKHGLALGAACYLFRPIEPPELLREIEACLGEPF
jgi:two-component system cell cycle response regulator